VRLFLTAFLMLFLAYSNTSIAASSEAPAIHLPGINGDFDLDRLKGKVVYLDFWASWCTPCRKSFPWMNEMQSRYKEQGFEVVAVNLDKDKKLADVFLGDMKVNFTVAFDASGKTAQSYKLTGMPNSYLIGRDGKLYVSHVGFREKDKSKMEIAIQRLLKL